MRLTTRQMNFKSIFLDFIFGVDNQYISMINWCLDCLTPLPDGLSCPGRRCQETGAELLSPVLCPMREFFTVPHVFLPESAGIRVIPGIPRNGILAVLPAKIAISVPRNSGGFWNGHRITKTESTGTESPEFFLIVIVIFFKSNTNYLIVITVNY